MLNSTHHWIYIPEQGDREPWTGQIVIPDHPSARATFEILRHSEGPFEDSIRVFENTEALVALLDYQRKATIIGPFVNRIDRGSIGVEYPVTRTRLEGSFQSLLVGLDITDLDEKLLKGVTIESTSFRLWYAPNFGPTIKHDNSDYEVKFSKTAPEIFHVKGLGEVTCSCNNKYDDSAGSKTFSPQVLMNLVFEEEKSVREVISLIWALDSLFGFLIGYRLRPPNVTVWTRETYTLSNDGKEYSYSAKLMMFNTKWNDEKVPDWFDIQCWRNDRSPNTQELISTFLSDRDSFMKRIHAINEASFFSKTLDRSFAAIAPALEEYLKGKFTEPDEKAYENLSASFFQYIEDCQDETIKEFSRKHIQEVSDGKKPGFKQLIERALAELAELNLNFSNAIARDIAKQRGTLFHTVPDFDQTRATNLLESTRAAILILTLLTYSDLGIDLRSLELSVHRFGKFRQFFPVKVSSGEN
mmetsp:Transcript_259/g.429  ORF Transcript_259/g.429 Transcript_259/m.429 type:complete len:471 (-) Transcript_259:245-1657(-)